ncbi:hypothetical protein LOD99_11288 [Oopsacas minuta]|uniref:Uncharacterized protein n=1 Tax=Oopsacas minuta TaxID=111878 RepID=A0AAV7K6J3_9METZ|nr:hypothetical protein LOD99_11288 [Oopsacas minuta]
MEAFHYFYNIGGDQLYQKDKKKGYTLLHMSAGKGNEFLVDMLLNKEDEEIDNNEQALDEATPLHLAVAHGHINIVESLLNAGAIATIFMREYSIMG